MYISQVVEAKKKIESQFYNILCKYIYKYIKCIYEKDDGKNKRVNFQKALIKITDWSPDKLDNEFCKFSKWSTKKYNINDRDLQKMLNTIVLLSTQTILNQSVDYIKSLLNEYSYPKMKMFYYKSIKKISRIFYEKPKDVYNIDQTIILYNIESITNTFLPIKEITSVLENYCEPTFENCKNINYNIDNVKSHETNTPMHTNTIAKNIQEKNENNLQYMSSENYESSSIDDEKIDLDTNDIRIIPNVVKNNNVPNQLKINDIDIEKYNIQKNKKNFVI
jgi:hypothetical protein